MKWIALLVLCFPCVAIACPLCRDATTTNGAVQHAGIFNSSVVVMLVALAVTMSCAIGAVVNGVVRRNPTVDPRTERRD